jgi:hypothetical protein
MRLVAPQPGSGGLFCTDFLELAMSIRLRCALTLSLAAVLAAGCEVSKSSNPLSPSVAGPIAGVTIGRPNALEPGQDWQIFMRDQPLKLRFQNVTSSGVRPISYTVEIASDAAFNSIVFKRTGVTAASGDTTVLQLPDALATGRTYWWRVRAEDGANSSDYSVPKSFVAVEPVVLGTPVLNSPIGTITTMTPEFKITGGSRSGPAAKIIYQVQVANDQAFASIAATFSPDETLPQTTIAQNYSFLNNKTYYWRVQAKDTGDSQAVSAWSSTQVFVTSQPAPPPPIGGGGGGGPVGTGDWKSCGSAPGDTLVGCVRSAVYVQSTEANAFEITKRVAWLLRGQGYGLLQKGSGENIITWQGNSFSISRVCAPGGYPVKVLSDAGTGGGNGASWAPDPADNVCSLPGRFIPAIDPALP